MKSKYFVGNVIGNCKSREYVKVIDETCFSFFDMYPEDGWGLSDRKVGQFSTFHELSYRQYVGMRLSRLFSYDIRYFIVNQSILNYLRSWF